MLSEAIKKEMKWHKENLREDIAKKVKKCAEALGDGMREGVYVMQPPTQEEYENYYLAKLNVYFELWASTWSR